MTSPEAEALRIRSGAVAGARPRVDARDQLGLGDEG